MASDFLLFISYSCLDKEHPVLLRIRDQFKELTESIGGDVFMAEDRLDPGRDFIAKVTNALKSADAFLVFLTEHSDASAWVNQEIGFARALNKPVYPVFDPSLKALKGMIQTIDGCRVDEPKKVDRLVKGLAEAAQIKRAQPTAQLSSPLALRPTLAQWILNRQGPSSLYVTLEITHRGSLPDAVNRVTARIYDWDFEPDDRAFPKLAPVDFQVLELKFSIERADPWYHDIPITVHTVLENSAKVMIKIRPGDYIDTFR